MLRFAMRKPLAGPRSAVEEFQSYQGPFELGSLTWPFCRTRMGLQLGVFWSTLDDLVKRLSNN
jgi:hypothetical protein